MKKNTLLTMAFLCVLMWGCQQNKDEKDEFEKTESGLQYKILTNQQENTRKPKLGDVLTLQMTYKTENDSVFFDTRTYGESIMMKLSEPAYKGGLEEGLLLLSPGDSAVFIVSADSVFEKNLHQPLPPFLKTGSNLKFEIKLEKIQTQEEVERELAGEMTKKMEQENTMMNKYIEENKITISPTESGLYYIPVMEGKGTQADSGRMVTVQYTGKLLDGKVFDTSLDKKEPFEFKLGRGEVIPGWEEGLRMMKAGGKATLVIPSNLAYGARGVRNIIPPYSPLVFEVELVDVK